MTTRRSQEEIEKHRSDILRLADGTRTSKQIAEITGRTYPDIHVDAAVLRRKGHAVPLRHCSIKIGEGKAVYRHYDAAGVLLYVGCSGNVIFRTATHATTAVWFQEIVRIDVQWFDSAEEACEAELVAIQTENPVHNKYGKLMRRKP